MSYKPPYHISPLVLQRVADIVALLTRWTGANSGKLSPKLRRNNRIRTIQASLAIENNTLSLEQVTAVLDNKRVLGLPREIQEVRNAFAAYQKLPDLHAHSVAHLLLTHELLMSGLVDDPGSFRLGGVGIFNNQRLVHMAPPASRIPALMDDLLGWVKAQSVHPLIISCVFHYEFEFIHPFADGNGRMGRLWQTKILSDWQPILAYLPVESIIRDRQAEYYQALADADNQADSTGFIEFMLTALADAIAVALAIPTPTATPKPTTKSIAKASEKKSDKTSEMASEKTSDKILVMLNKNGTTTIAELSRDLNVSARSIERNLAKLTAAGRLQRLGSAKGGRWQVNALSNVEQTP